MAQKGLYYPLSRDSIIAILREQRENIQTRLRTPDTLTRELLGELCGEFSGQTAFQRHSAIVISGLRRVGKSTLLLQLIPTFENTNYHYVNFEDERFAALQSSELSLLHEALIQLYGPAKVLLLDELQVIDGWERWARRLIDQGNKLVITGSSTQLISKELGTKLTGRYKKFDLLPFSFGEYCKFKKITPVTSSPTTAEKALILNCFEQYINCGGIPLFADKYEPDALRTLFQDIIFRDVVTRYRIRTVPAIRELALTLASNLARFISYKKLVEPLSLSGPTTVKNFVGHLESAWLFFSLNRYSRSVKQQQINPKKIFGIDTAMMRAVGIESGERIGYFLENVIYLELKRIFADEIYYYQTSSGREIDLYIPTIQLFIQVTLSLSKPETRHRELTALEEALDEIPEAKALIITVSEREEVKINERVIQVLPVYAALLPGGDALRNQKTDSPSISLT